MKKFAWLNSACLAPEGAAGAVPLIPGADGGTAPDAEGGTAPGAVPPAGWLDKFDAEGKAWAESKGWGTDTGIDVVASSYRNLEKMFGADKAGRTLLAPKDANDKEAFDAIYARLGRPEKPEGYDFNIEGADEKFLSTARGWFHKAGLTVDQAKAVTEAYRAQELDAVTQVQQQFKQQEDDLRRDWGAEFDQKLEIGKAAVRAAGMTDDEAQLIAGALGPLRAAKIMEFFGRNYQEGTPPGRDQRGSSTLGHMTPAAAEAEITKKYADPAFMARYGHRDPAIRTAAAQEMEQLMALAVNAKAG